jgi:hypothetical protein
MPRIDERPTEMFEYSALKDKINEALNEGIGEEKRIILEDG